MLRRKFFFQNLCFHKFLTLRSQNCVASDFTRKYFLLSKRVSIFSNFGKNVAESSPRSYAKACFVFSQIIESTRRKSSTSFLIFSKMKLVMLSRQTFKIPNTSSKVVAISSRKRTLIRVGWHVRYLFRMPIVQNRTGIFLVCTGKQPPIH